MPRRGSYNVCILGVKLSEMFDNPVEEKERKDFELDHGAFIIARKQGGLFAQLTVILGLDWQYRPQHMLQQQVLSRRKT